MSKLPVSMLVVLAALVILNFVVSVPANAQTLSVLYNFGTNPGDPIDGGTAPNVVAQGRDGNLYTTSWAGGTNNLGTVYRVTPAGTLTVLYSFDGVHGDEPISGVILATDGNFYGTTSTGGASSNGTVFKITPGGILTTLYNFTGGSDGGIPYAPPIQGNDGNLYGTARSGGGGYGTVYKLTLSGTFAVLHQFAGTDGATPLANLSQATDGNFYGTTDAGGNGTCNCGTVFKITPSGTLTVLYNFDNTHGNSPLYASLVQASNGKFYGTTYYGGANGVGVIYQMTSSGVVTVLHDFTNYDGGPPTVALVQATDGSLYSVGGGKLFRINPSSGNFSVQYTYGAEGNPSSPLLQNTNGVFYGKTNNGGTAGDGVFYSFSEGLKSFVTFLPRQSLGKVGASIGILGQGFTGTTAVSFNGTSATFTVTSDTYLTATVPSGAITGPVTVLTPGAHLMSNMRFRVTPQILSFSPTSGPVGTQVAITGVSLTQTTKVTFGGVAATTFVVGSDSQVTATVPTGATTGKIMITTAGGTVTSSGTFTVTP
jgi:uncharacterized repeat protein (TIGR03803 family)